MWYGGAGWGQPGMMGYDGSGWWMALHGVVWLLFLALLIVAVVALVRFLFGGHGAQPPVPPRAGERAAAALDLLAQRYARGEIDREEYLQKKADLSA